MKPFSFVNQKPEPLEQPFLKKQGTHEDSRHTMSPEAEVWVWASQNWLRELFMFDNSHCAH